MSKRKPVEPSTDTWLSNSTITRSILLKAIASGKKGTTGSLFFPLNIESRLKTFHRKYCATCGSHLQALIYKNDVVWPVEVHSVIKRSEKANNGEGNDEWGIRETRSPFFLFFFLF